MSNYVPQARSLADLLKGIDSGKIQLPNFQRNFVWRQGKVKKLLDSIQKNYPAGSLLFLKVSKNQSRMGFTKFNDAKNVDNDNLEYLVLDGQQRLTSCYHSFYNRGVSSYFIDLRKLFECNEKMEPVDFESVIIHKSINSQLSGYLSKNLLSISYLSDRERLDSVLVPYKDDLRGRDEEKKYLEFLELRLNSYLKCLMNYTFPIIELPETLPMEAICMIFQTINTTGQRLSAFDICVAKFMPQNIDLRIKIENACNAHPFVSNALKDNEECVLQAIALLAGKPIKKNDLVDNLEVIHIDSWWDSVIAGLDKCMQMLDSFGCGTKKNLSIVPYKSIIPLLAAIIVQSKLDSLSQVQKGKIEAKIKKFFYFSAFTLRYTEGVEAKLREDFREINNWILTESEPMFIKYGIDWNKNRAIEFDKSGAFGKAILCIVNSQSPMDFYSDKKVGIGNELDKCERHHIFPKSYYANEKNINSIFNITFLLDNTNSSINNNSTDKYFEIMKSVVAAESILVEKLENHFINGETFVAFKESRFQDFIEHRANEFVRYIEESLSIKVNQLSNEDASDELIDDSDVA